MADDRHHRRHKHKKSSRNREYEKSYSSQDDRPRKNSNRHDNEPVSWDKHKTALNKIFFRDNDIIKKGSPDYDDFWLFLRKYSAYNNKEKKSNFRNVAEMTRHSTRFDLPLDYDKRHRVSFTLKYTDIDELMSRLPPKDEERDGPGLSKEMVTEFRDILFIYLDFLQKEKFQKLCKLRKSQANLPIYKFKEKIASAVRDHSIVIIAGDTGCGKSTQVPQYLADSGWTNIACTQPRRIACTSLCKRVAYETMNEYGSEIGYQIRFEKSKTKHTRILFLTEGLLLRQVTSDPSLSNYNVVILDEVHERHLHSDFLLGLMKCLSRERPDLRIILMSATINIKLFADYFGQKAPVIQVPGRLFPIQLQYFPVTTEDQSSRNSRINPSPYIRILNLIDKKFPDNEKGDLLVFLSGITEISIVAGAAQIYAQQTKRWIVLPLHSTLSVAEQDKVFDIAPEGVRKCIISTNIAETSVTIDGVRFVADSGKAKEMSFDETCRMQRLQEFWISKASAEQRKGRAGRTGPGVCYRLYSEAEFDEMTDYSLPEIQRVPCDSLILQMISMGLPDVRKFPFIEPPPSDGMEHSIQNLKEQGAITDHEQLTSIGRMLAKLPVDIPIGKILIMGTLFHMMDPILSLAAVLSVQSPITNRGQRDPDAVAARRNLESDHGDTFTLLRLYNEWLNVKADRHSNSRKWCKHRELEEQRFYDVTKLRQQFKQLLQDAGLIQMMASRGNLSSVERAQRHGEVKRLREMKRDFHHAPKKRKILKMDDEIEGIEADDDDNGGEGEGGAAEVDIKNIDFQLSFNQNEIAELSRSSQSLKYQDVMLLKVILCSGLYPQVALADEHNSYKSDADQLFHTRAKPFVVVHPLSIFTSQPDCLQVTASDIIDCPGFESRHPVSNRHQLLLFMSLLETTKPYLMNATRVPAVQIVVLFASAIDTNHDFSRLVCDGWLEVKFPNASDGQDVIMQTMSLRELWMQILSEKIEGMKGMESLSNSVGDSKRKRLQEGDLARQLVAFLHTEVFYTINRLLAADLKDLYIGPDGYSTSGQDESSAQDVKFFGDESRPHPKKGGLQIQSYLTYGCLLDPNLVGQSYMQVHWTCPLCESNLVVSTLERIQHELECKRNVEETKDEQPTQSDDPTKKGYFCEKCGKELFLTPTEILRHKKDHVKKETD